MGLSGTLPLEIGFLPELIELNLSHNKLKGHVPEELALAPLQILDLSENDLTGYIPGALCRKAGINGNGQNGVFSCDIITCPMGTFHPDGHADPGDSGEYCKPCSLIDGLVLGNSDCGVFAYDPSQQEGSSPFTGDTSWVDIVIVLMLGLGILLTGIFIWKRSGYAIIFALSRYNRTAPARNDDDDEDKIAPRSKTIVATPEFADIQISINNEWNNTREKNQTVWLDFPEET
jgi:hypothetical protein